MIDTALQSALIRLGQASRIGCPGHRMSRMRCPHGPCLALSSSSSEHPAMALQHYSTCVPDVEFERPKSARQPSADEICAKPDPPERVESRHPWMEGWEMAVGRTGRRFRRVPQADGGGTGRDIGSVAGKDCDQRGWELVVRTHRESGAWPATVWSPGRAAGSATWLEWRPHGDSNPGYYRERVMS